MTTYPCSPRTFIHNMFPLNWELFDNIIPHMYPVMNMCHPRVSFETTSYQAFSLGYLTVFIVLAAVTFNLLTEV